MKTEFVLEIIIFIFIAIFFTIGLEPRRLDRDIELNTSGENGVRGIEQIPGYRDKYCNYVTGIAAGSTLSVYKTAADDSIVIAELPNRHPVQFSGLWNTSTGKYHIKYYGDGEKTGDFNVLVGGWVDPEYIVYCSTGRFIQN